MPDEVTTFKQMDEKHVAVEVDKMLWSPKFDLVALSNVQGEVVLHRLSWQKVWTAPPPTENTRVVGMAWRPDGKMLAAAYTDGQILLYHIENSEICNTIVLDSGINIHSIQWITQYLPENMTWSFHPYDEDNYTQYLPKLQPLNKTYGTLTKGALVEEVVEDSKKLSDQKELNLLLIAHGSNSLSLYAYGVFPAAVLQVPTKDGFKIEKVHGATLSQDLNSLVVVTEQSRPGTDNSEFFTVTLDTSILASRNLEISVLALKSGQVLTLLEYLQKTIQQMSEAWEDILVEMDSKLSKFAAEKQKTGNSSVSNDFLELLMFGTPSDELQVFLLHELTEKGLKKLGHSIETSYSNIQKLVVRHLQVVSQAIIYHLSDLRGMAQWYEKFGVLGMKIESYQKAVTNMGSFVLKTIEIQQVIDDSIKNFKAFFRWLYVVILRLSNEKPPAAFSKMTQHDINFVAEFLRDNFSNYTVEREDDVSMSDITEDGGNKNGAFKLEKVGQYLRKEDLHFPANISSNPWIQFQRSSFQLKDTDVLYPVENSKSLVQLQDKLEETFKKAMSKPSVVIGKTFEELSSTQMFTRESRFEGDQTIKMCQFTDNEAKKIYTIYTEDYLPCDSFVILRQSSNPRQHGGLQEAVVVKVGELPSSQNTSNASWSSSAGPCSSHKVVDLASYDEKTLSLLLVEEGEEEVPILLQVPLKVITDSMYSPVASGMSVSSLKHTIVDIGPLVDPMSLRRLENMKAHSFAVSGSRRTATVLFSSKRRVRIFWMDIEEDEDEDEEEEEGEEADKTADQSKNTDLSENPSTDANTETDISGIMEMQIESEEDKENLSSISLASDARSTDS